MSRGPGRCQRRIIELLENAPRRILSRLELENALVAEGYDPSNVLRSLRRLHRARLVSLGDARHKHEALVCLPRKVEPLTDNEVSELLAGLGGRK